MKKKILSLIMTLIICTALVPPTNAFSFEFTHRVTSDTDEHWAEDSINELNLLGIMNGYNGYTNPDNIITRGEFTALIARAFDLKPSDNVQHFSDIAPHHIFFENINAAHASGIIDGFPDGTFRSDNMITREEIILIISRLTKDTSDASKADFKDIKSDYRYMAQLSKVTSDKIVNGYPDGTFRPYEKTTRAESATIIMNAMKKYIEPDTATDMNAFATKYLTEHFSNIHTMSGGMAKKDSEYISYAYQKAAELGFALSNSVSDIVVTESVQDGPFTSLKAVYNVTRLINGAPKTYFGQSEIKAISQNGNTFVYDHRTRIIKQTKINLTWEIYSNPPSSETPGVNVVSPSSFVVSDEKEYGKTAEYIYSESGAQYTFNSSLNSGYVTYARQKGYEIWAMYKTNFDIDVASVFLNSSALRRQSADRLIKNILTHSVDGINFDFENMYRRDKGAYTNHVKEITLISHVLGANVSVDVSKYEPTSSAWSMCYDRDALAGYADYLALMAYDQYYSGSKIPGPVSGLGWTAEVVELTLKEVPADKLILGMPFYIRSWEVKNGRTVKSQAISMATAVKTVTENNASVVYDEKFGLNKYTWTKDGKNYVLWMENADSIAKRAEICNAYSLAGVASWRRGFETPDVWNALANALYGW